MATQNETTATTADTNAGTVTAIRDGAAHAYESTRERAADAARSAGDGIEANPLAVLAGGLAIGALAGALLPKSDSEQKILGTVGKRLTDTVAAAASAAREAGKEQLSSAIPDKDQAKETLRSAFGNVVQAAKEGGKSAATGSNTSSDTGAAV